MPSIPWVLSPDRCFDADPARRAIARALYAAVKDLPLVSPHGHVPPALLADPAARLGTPAELFIIPDHYVFRMLYSQGVPLEDLGVPTRDGTPVETDHRRIWQRFAEHFYLFRGTPTGLWLADELINVFGVTERLNGDSAQRDLRPPGGAAGPPGVRAARAARALQDRRCSAPPTPRPTRSRTTAAARGRAAPTIRPTFRPDAVVNLRARPGAQQIAALSEVSGIDIVDYASYIRALEQRRAFFKQLGALATDHAALTPYTARLSGARGRGDLRSAPCAARPSDDDAARFTAHMLIEFARMSVEDGLVMQLHVGSLRNHNAALFARFGPDMGADIPVATEWTRNLQPLLNAYGNDPRFRLILFTLDESTYSRELAPLAGHYPARAARPALVVLRQRQRHAPLLRPGDRDGRAVQHRRLQRRHPRVRLDPRAPRRLAARELRLAGRAGGAGAAGRGRGRRDGLRLRVWPGQARL